jgi:2-polyprenyl-3-methyl-5-hydroxy-6-metoxy-1,4-benzoquinol methylase
LQQNLQVGTREYEQLVREELGHYTKIFREGSPGSTPALPLTQAVPPTWTEVERRAAHRVAAETGDTMMGHLKRQLAHPGVRMLSLGSGPGGIELQLAAECPEASVTCVDLNEDLLAMGRQHASERGLKVEFRAADLNKVELERSAYDLVFCHAALHHVLDLEHVASEIRAALRPQGRLIAVDVVAPNGYRMWPENRVVLHKMWATLPPRLRINHTGYAEPRLDTELWEPEESTAGMECIRAQEILPVLAANFRPVYYVPYFSLCRRLLDTMYGPNYYLGNPLDMAILNWIWELDVWYLETQQLRPETFFGMYEAK